MGATEHIQEIVRREESRIAASWEYPDRRLALLEICRAIDSAVVTANHQREEVVELCRQGANKAVSLFIDDSCKEPRTPIFPSNSHTFQWAHSVLQHCGRIAVCEKLLDYERAGLGRFSSHGGGFTFEVTASHAGLEALERKEFESLADSIAEMRAPTHNLLNASMLRMHERMRPLVYCWADHYIGYTTHPEVDRFFHQKGLLAAERMSGQDDFDDRSEFGGLPFGMYKATVSTLIGWAIKHIHFASLLAERQPELQLQNLLTITADVGAMTADLAAALDVTTREASQALGVLELNPDNFKELCVNGHAPAPLIRAAFEQFIKPVSGFLVEPFHCMIRNLRAQYRSDWDRHVNQREELFRNDLFRLFPQDWLAKIPRSVVLKRGRQRLTDVDAAIIDKRNGVAGLFQLKWQDGFGHSMRERSAKMRNFYREVNSWTDAVTGFLSQGSSAEINRVFGLPKSPQTIACCLFVVGRHFAHFSGDDEPDGRTANAVWPQLVRLAKANRDAADPLRALHSALQNDSPAKKKVSMPTSSFRMDDSTFTILAIE